ncbi:hypothetical protein EYF80_009269 [Liparis tanakae]|uniref:Uncharacterized protein n=1 Tax=Liparis tanakae TaxID=230148 RepID=A0A4Z2IRA1_9TELE|nr:hypothetical protein EYF80_009269 [Liparis tanakae]
MALQVDNIESLLLEADEELYRMETTVGEPTNHNRDEFIKHLLSGTKKLTPKFALANENIISHIIKCSTGILHLSLGKCDIDTNPNPKSLFENIFEIFRTISLLIGNGTGDNVLIRHPLGNIYQSRSFCLAQMLQYR